MARALKKTDKEKNPGLAKLPKDVRNKMGYMAEGAEMPAPGDKYKRRRRRKARRQRKGKKQKGSCYNMNGKNICPGDPGYDVTIAAEGAKISAPVKNKKKGKVKKFLKKIFKRNKKCKGGKCPSFKHGGKMMCTC